MGAQQGKQAQEGQNFSDYYQTETRTQEKEMQYIENLAAKLNQSTEEIQIIQAFLEQRGYKFSNRLLGKGGTSVLLRAENTLGQKIALKILKCNSKEEYLNNLQEYRLMKSTNSDHVIKVHELLEYRSSNKLIQFLAMERCLYNLNSQITGGKKMSRVQIYDVCLQLAKGLSALHQQNILHLDIKPGNIVLGFDNKWKFIDLGLSKLLPQNQAYSDDIQGLTKYYSSPEQYQQFYELSKNKVGKQSDIYSLGLVFLELTGVRLSEESIEESKIKRTNFEAVFNPDFEDLNKVLSKMLQYNPDHRCNLTQIKNYIYQQFSDEVSTTTTGGACSPINLQQFKVTNAPILKKTERSRSQAKLDQVQNTNTVTIIESSRNRHQKQQSMHDLSSLENFITLSPKKNHQPQPQQPQLIQQIKQEQAPSKQNQNFSQVFELRRSASQASIGNEQNFQEGKSPKKVIYPQKLDQIQQIRNMLANKIASSNFSSMSPIHHHHHNHNANNNLHININNHHHNQNLHQQLLPQLDSSPYKPRSKVILPSLSRVPSSNRVSPNSTFTKHFPLQMPVNMVQ